MEQPIYTPFFGVMGAASAMVFSGEYCFKNMVERFRSKCQILDDSITSASRCKHLGLACLAAMFANNNQICRIVLLFRSETLTEHH